MMMTTAGKQLVGRSRPPLSDAVPPLEYSAAFPSGPALGSLAIAGIVAYLVVVLVAALPVESVIAGLAMFGAGIFYRVLRLRPEAMHEP